MKGIGFGGVFWRTENAERLNSWYREVLGISLDDKWNPDQIRITDRKLNDIFVVFV